MADSNVPEGAVVITTADIYRQLIDLTREVGELKGAISKTVEMNRQVEDHEQRLRAMERSRWPLPSLAALLSCGALATAVFQAVGK